MTTTTKSIRVLPWGEEIYKEFPLHKKSANKFYARHGKNADGREYIEFSKFGPKPNTDDETYSQKLRLYSPTDWVKIKHYVETELAGSIGWDLAKANNEFTSDKTEEQAETS